MLGRLISCTSQKGVPVVRIAIRRLRTSIICGSSGHHDESVPPVYIPKPASTEKTWLGTPKVSSISPPFSYKPGKDDYTAFIGAGIGVLLTLLAIVFRTDVFGMNIKKKDHQNHNQLHRTTEHETKVVASQEEESPEVSEGEIQYVETLEGSDLDGADISKQETPPANENNELPVSNVVKENEEIEEETFKAEEEEFARSSSETSSTSTGKTPEFVEYLLVGAGTAAYYAALAIRARDANAKVLMVGEEKYLPYNRPPLSKELWWYGGENAVHTLEYKSISGKKRTIFFEEEGFFVPVDDLNSSAHGGVSLLRGKKVTKLCPDSKKAFLDDGTTVSYNKCLLATGGKPKTIPILDSANSDVKKRILYFRGVNDYQQLEKLCMNAKSVTVVGGGFLGSELAYSIKRKYKDMVINQVITEDGNLSNILPAFLSSKVTNSLRANGVNILTNTNIMGVLKNGDKLELQVDSSKPLVSDYVLVAIGIQPDTAIAEASGLEIDPRLGGISTDAELRVRSGIYAAGDVCSFYDKSLGRRRVEHWENAHISGRLAGENMTGAGRAFWYQPAYFTKISPHIHINAVGITDSSLPTVSVFAKDNEESERKYERGIVFYMGDKDKVVGVLLLNVFGSSIDVARRLIEDARSITDIRELAKLFPLYENADSERKM